MASKIALLVPDVGAEEEGKHVPDVGAEEESEHVPDVTLINIEKYLINIK